MNTPFFASSRALSHTFKRFFASKKAGGIVLIVCTLLSLLLANSPVGETYLSFWHHEIVGMSVEHWINDGLMAIFFLMIGLEFERELYNGELSDFRSALLPIVAAVAASASPHCCTLASTPARPRQVAWGFQWPPILRSRFSSPIWRFRGRPILLQPRKSQSFWRLLQPAYSASCG
ncbi:Na+/H+ antiporter 1 [Nitrosospira briensis]|uniref:Na+/H+ antiporter 1 n=1 Tax=Nitrosospira briensis TaxID=35799 RepID=A0A1I5BIU1_9PROT|nr:Na+/H+ antiporter 1 [Nitrosospira briensis]